MASSITQQCRRLHGAPTALPAPIVAHTITYRKRGTHPPVYLAGSFAEPQWVPREMDYAQDADGEYTFASQVRAVPGHEYQFKFKIGDGNNWMLDEDSPVGTDSMGNKNNLLSVPLSGAPTKTRSVPGKVLNELGIVDLDSPCPTPDEAANTAAEVADTAELLDQDDPHASDSDGPSYTWKDPDPVRQPLFAHESFGAYEFVDDGLDHTGLGLTAPLSQSRSTSRDLTTDDADAVDMNDPTIERFPSDRGSVMDTLRKIQSSLGEDQVSVENAPPSPQNPGGVAWRRTSLDSSGDEALLSPGSLSPAISTTSRKRDNRPSHTTFAKTMSNTSLGSIAEEPKAGNSGISANEKHARKPRTAVFDSLDASTSEEDEGLRLRGTKVKTKQECGGGSPFSDQENEQPAEHIPTRREQPRSGDPWGGWLRLRKWPGFDRGQDDSVVLMFGLDNSHSRPEGHQRTQTGGRSRGPLRPEPAHMSQTITAATLGFVGGLALGIAWWKGGRSCAG